MYGLCSDCNNLTSDKADPAYIQFHDEMAHFWSPTARRLLLDPHAVPATVAPGLVARSVLVGMFAINDRLQEHFPQLATALGQRSSDAWLPEPLRLRLALTDDEHSRLGGPVGYMRVLNVREYHMPHADIWFPPLAWCLTSAQTVDRALGRDITSTWGDVTEWIRYGPDVTRDLRHLAGRLPVVRPPRFGADDWMVMASDTMMTALEGRPRLRTR